MTEEKENKKEKSAEENPDFKFIVRIVNTDIDGERSVIDGLTSIAGVNYRISRIITNDLDLKPRMRMGDLTDDQISGVADYLEEISERLPSWLLNRQRDLDTGDDNHFISSDLEMVHRDDVNLLRKIRCYRGIRHETGQKVRGQRSRSNGRTGATVGVSRKKIK